MLESPEWWTELEFAAHWPWVLFPVCSRNVVAWQRALNNQGVLHRANSCKILPGAATPPLQAGEIRGTKRGRAANLNFQGNHRFAAVIVALLKCNMNVQVRRFVIPKTLLEQSLLYLEAVSIVHCTRWHLCHQGLVGHYSLMTEKLLDAFPRVIKISWEQNKGGAASSEGWLCGLGYFFNENTQIFIKFELN